MKFVIFCKAKNLVNEIGKEWKRRELKITQEQTKLEIYYNIYKRLNQKGVSKMIDLVLLGILTGSFIILVYGAIGLK